MYQHQADRYEDCSSEESVPSKVQRAEAPVRRTVSVAEINSAENADKPANVLDFVFDRCQDNRQCRVVGWSFSLLGFNRIETLIYRI